MLNLKDVLYETQGHIATVTLNRPQRLNALGGTLEDDVNEAMKAAELDKEVRVVVVTGAGRAFCAGLDVKERADKVGAVPLVERLYGLELPRTMLRMNKPTIASVNGPAVGWGFELALLCDLRIAADDAKMGDIHVKRGLIQDAAGAYTLPRIVGWSKACEILLTGELFSAAEMERLGVVNKVVPSAKLKGATAEFANRLACNAPLGVQMTKRLMRQGLKGDLDDIMDYSMSVDGILLQTDDSKEGFKSFLEKREPSFKGK